MNIETGEIVEYFNVVPIGHVAIKRDLTEKEKYEKKIRLYSPCGCGSGKKFKFCCFKKKTEA